MSTINGSDGSSRQDEVVRRNREEYQQKESELVKKHQKEIRRLTEAHYGEVEKLKQTQQQQMNDLKKRAGESISVRDHKYQKDIEGLRALHRKQLAEVAGQAQKNKELLTHEQQRELESMKRRYSEQVSDLHSDHQIALKSKDEEHTRTLTEMREQQQKSVLDYREKINNKHKKEVSVLAQNQASERADLERQQRAYRGMTEARMRDQEIRSLQDRQKASEDLIDAVRRERMNQQENEAVLRQGFRQGLDDTRERFEERARQHRELTQSNQEGARQEIYGRINGQVRQLERQNTDLKHRNIRDDLTRKREVEAQVENVKRAYGENIRDLERQRKEAIESGNQRRHQDIRELHEKSSDLMSQTSKDYLRKIDDQEARHQIAVKQMEGSYQAQVEQQGNSADLRVKNIRAESDLEKQRLFELHEDTRKLLKESHQDQISELMRKQEQERAIAIESMKEVMRKQELEHQEKLAQLSMKFESELAQSRDELNKVRRGNDERSRRLVEQMQRSKDMELATQQTQFESKMNKLAQKHAEDLKSMERRHQERMEHMSVAMQKKV